VGGGRGGGSAAAAAAAAVRLVCIFHARNRECNFASLGRPK
jgi:4-diphosphocytidyl-2C-methyl-D-erythritol kinase